MKILIVEDEEKIVKFIKKGLKSEGHTVDSALNGEDGLFMAQDGKYELVILDVMLPKLDGITIAKKLKTRPDPSKIIMLTAKDAVEDKIKGLDAGADDYLTKPFSFEELLARIRALTRRDRGIHFETLKIGDLTLDPGSHTVKRGPEEIKLSTTEFKLLKYLMRNPNKVVSKTLILENVWGYDFSPESNIVDVYIKYLRDKIDKGHKKNLIQTVHGVGFRLCE
ncbi:response regulator transcription factor [Candidatus Saganbacteria bacterium]|nr:response regulator transcription factor [Candidatus Saganbacteria bacterium]